MRGVIFLSVIVRQLIKNSQYRTRNRTQANTTFSTEIGRKILYAAREEGQFHLVWFCCTSEPKAANTILGENRLLFSLVT